MKTSYLFIGLIILSSLVSVFLVFSAWWEICFYFSFDAKTNATVYRWHIVQKKTSQWALEGEFYFFIQGEKVLGRTQLAPPYFLQEKAAILAQETLSLQPWEVFYSSSNKEHNSLQRFFPFRSCIHAILAIGVFLYFIFLKRWTQNMVSSYPG